MRASSVAEKAGIRSVSVVASDFMPQARAIVRAQGTEQMNIAEFPSVIMAETTENFRRLVRTVVLDQIVAGFAESRPPPDESSDEAEPDAVVFEGNLDEVLEFFHEKLWTDGLPIVPPTRDRDQTRAGLAAIPAPNGATAIGDALALAQRMLPKNGHRVVVLITDGENNAGMDPLQQAKLLAARAVTLYTIGIGTNSGALIPGTLQEAGIDEDALRSYARVTGGAYSRAEDAVQLHQALERLGRTTSFQRGTVDISLQAAAAGALLMVTTFLWMRLT
jgi:Ca-activated chloride channel family protein